jgi:hypothetical protein
VIVVPRGWRVGLAVVGALCLILGTLGALTEPQTFFRAYLIAYTFWLALSLGCLGLAFIQFLTGGIWGLITRRIFEAGAACLPLLAILFIPVLIGLPALYPWTDPSAVSADPVLQHKAIYLNIPFFVARAVVYFIAWIVLSNQLRSWSLRQDASNDPLLTPRLQRLSIIGLLVLPLTASFAAIDWWMSLEPTWFSTMFPVTICIGALLLALGFTVLLVTRVGAYAELTPPPLLNDLGSLLLAFVMLWAYVTYFQYMLIWAGNLKEEITWYIRRADGAWIPLAWTIAVAGFVIPFGFLLFRGLKRNRLWLGRLAVLLVLMQVVESYWLIQPAFTPDGPTLSWLQPLIWIGVGGLWLAVFTWSLGAAAIVPANDPRTVVAMENAHATA